MISGVAGSREKYSFLEMLKKPDLALEIFVESTFTQVLSRDCPVCHTHERHQASCEVQGAGKDGSDFDSAAEAMPGKKCN